MATPPPPSAVFMMMQSLTPIPLANWRVAFEGGCITLALACLTFQILHVKYTCSIHSGHAVRYSCKQFIKGTCSKIYSYMYIVTPF